MGNSALGRGTAIEENKVKASSGDGSPNYLDGKVGNSVKVVSNLLEIGFTGQAQGDVAYFNGTNWVRLPPGTSGQLLQTNGAAANPSWVTSTAPAESAFTDWSGSASPVGFSATAFVEVYYKKIGKSVFMQFLIDGTSNASATSFTLPFAATLPSSGSPYGTIWTGICGISFTSGAWQNGLLFKITAATTVGFDATPQGNGFDPAGQKILQGQFHYQTT
jgi:hypothetical protein